MSVAEDIIKANSLCAKLASELDAGDLSNIESTVQQLEKFPARISMQAVSSSIKLDRIVEHWLDENAAFQKYSKRITKVFDKDGGINILKNYIDQARTEMLKNVDKDTQFNIKQIINYMTDQPNWSEIEQKIMSD